MYENWKLKDIYTIVYYTSNRENSEFEKKVQETLLKNKGDIDIISVSQKPMDLGKNICVGTGVGFSDQNGMKQMLIGAREAKTPYIIFAESDFLYPPEYFQFIPKKEKHCYRYDNVWIVYKDSKYGGYHRKKYSEGAQICSRDLLIESYEEYFKGIPEWWDGRPPHKKREPLHRYPWEYFGSDNPCLSFKTGDGMRRFTGTMGEVPHAKELPYWGNIKDIRKKYL